MKDFQKKKKKEVGFKANSCRKSFMIRFNYSKTSPERKYCFSLNFYHDLLRIQTGVVLAF